MRGLAGQHSDQSEHAWHRSRRPSWIYGAAWMDRSVNRRSIHVHCIDNNGNGLHGASYGRRTLTERSLWRIAHRDISPGDRAFFRLADSTHPQIPAKKFTTV